MAKYPNCQCEYSEASHCRTASIRGRTGPFISPSGPTSRRRPAVGPATFLAGLTSSLGEKQKHAIWSAHCPCERVCENSASQLSVRRCVKLILQAMAYAPFLVQGSPFSFWLVHLRHICISLTRMTPCKYRVVNTQTTWHNSSVSNFFFLIHLEPFFVTQKLSVDKIAHYCTAFLWLVFFWFSNLKVAQLFLIIIKLSTKMISK